MKEEQQRIIELFAALIFVLLLVLIVALTLRPALNNFTTSNVVISNSFNSYEGYGKCSYKCDSKYDGRFPREIEYSERSLKFDSRARHRIRENVFGGKYDEYVVYVKNKDYVGGYFTVKFHFYDYLEEDVQSITKYISPGHEVAFVYRNVDYSSDYSRWDYKVLSEE